MAKYNKRIVKRICDLIRADTYTIAEICSMSGIHHDSYYEWLKNKPEFAEAVSRAREQFDQIIVKEAKNSLRKLVNGYEVEEKTVVYVDSKDREGVSKPKIKEQKVVKKHFQPNPHSVQFVLTNKTGGEYKNYQTNELTGKDGKDLFATLTDEELDKRIRALEDKLKN